MEALDGEAAGGGVEIQLWVSCGRGRFEKKVNSLAAKVVCHKVLLRVRLPGSSLGRKELQVGRTLKSELVVEGTESSARKA